MYWARGVRPVNIRAERPRVGNSSVTQNRTDRNGFARCMQIAARGEHTLYKAIEYGNVRTFTSGIGIYE